MPFAIAAALVAAITFPSPAHPLLTAHVPDSVAQGTAQRVGAAPAAQTLQLAISLPLRDENGLRQLLPALYDPAGPLYRHYLNVAEFTARYGPSVADYTAVMEYARAHGLHPHAPAANRQVLDVDGSVSDVERAFHVTIGLYRDRNAARVYFAPDREPTIDLALPVLHVSGLDNRVVPRAHLVRGALAENAKRTGSGPGGDFIGSDIRRAYYGGSALTGTGQSLGLFEYAGYNLADVRAYFRAVGQRDNVPVVGVSVNGANLNCSSATCDDGEQVLDIEEAVSMAPGLRQLVVYVGSSDVSILNQMASDDTSKQLSCSWGWDPDAAEIDPILEEFAAQGQSFLVATGDYGYHLKEGGVWPADDALSTAVGGTDLTTTGPGGAWAAETGWALSGGGPSPDRVTIPAYQLPFITPQNGGSKLRRNVPDIAGDANTNNFSCYDGACFTGNGGTSYAAPLWAGYIALANQLADALNRPPVGFLNPALYRIGGSRAYHTNFHDEIHVNNGKYDSIPGFDLVTGFGSPNGDALIEALARGR